MAVKRGTLRRMKTDERTIGEHRYRITQVPSKIGRRLLARLFKLFGAGLDDVLGQAVATGKVPKVATAGLAGVLVGLARTLTEEDVDYFCDTLAEYTQVNVGGDKWVPLPGIFDVHFAGNYGGMLGWLQAALEVNFGTFIDGLGSATAGAPGGTPPAP